MPKTRNTSTGHRLASGEASRPIGVTILLMLTGVFWLITLIYIGVLFIGGRIPSIEGATPLERSYIAMFYWGLNITDLIWFQILTVAALLGLWKMTSWGWTAGIMLSTIWVYTTTFFIIGDVIAGPSIGQITYWFFFAYGILSFAYLWKIREIFWRKRIGTSS
jgi:hypothetical protein